MWNEWKGNFPLSFLEVIMRYYFLNDPSVLVLGKLATTEFGDIYINNEKLYIPETKSRRYVYSFYNGTWSCIDGIVVYKNTKLPFYFDYSNLIVVNNGFFNYIKPDVNTIFTEESKSIYIRDYYRVRREKVCFNVINRGKLWYDHLTIAQISELNDWYEKWLDVTVSLAEPIAPKWINIKLNKIEDEELL